MREQRRGGVFGYVKITVQAIPDGARHARCLDDNGNEYQVPLALRMGRSGFPKVGDVWLLNKVAGHWVFAVYRGKTKPIVITAPRDGADRLTIQLFDAMVELGMVVEEDRSRESNPD